MVFFSIPYIRDALEKTWEKEICIPWPGGRSIILQESPQLLCWSGPFHTSIFPSQIPASIHRSKKHIKRFYHTPLFKIPIENPVWEPLPADADALQNTVTPQLVQDKAVFHSPWEEKQETSASCGISQKLSTVYGKHQQGSYLGFWSHWELYSAQSADELFLNLTSACSGFPKRWNLTVCCRLLQIRRYTVMKNKIYIFNISWILMNEII